jgi:hypothetical protein
MGQRAGRDRFSRSTSRRESTPRRASRYPPTIAAAATATFIALKPGLLTGDGPDHCGELSVHDLGLDVAAVATGVRLEWRPLARELPAILARRTRKTHKGTFGRAMRRRRWRGTRRCRAARRSRGDPARRRTRRRRAGGAQSAARRLGVAELMLRDAASVGDDYDAWVVGPGLGTSERAHALVAKFTGRPQPSCSMPTRSTPLPSTRRCAMR